MNHQPFETWLLNDEPLTPEEQRSLQQHLTTCEHCRTLSGAWSEVEHLMRSAPVPQPPSGFVGRFQIRLHAYQARRTRRQAWLLVLLNVGGMVVITGIFLALLLLTVQSPLDWLVASTQQVMRLLALLKAVGNTALTVWRWLPPAWWLVSLELLFTGTLLWIVSLRKFIPSRRVSQ